MQHIGMAVLMMIFVASPVTLSSQQDLPKPIGTTRLVVFNSLIGGFSAGIASAAGERPFWKGFLRGAAGGAVVFAGKRIIAEEGSLASWSGRQIAAIGASEVRNAGAGRRVMEEIVLPLGPFR